MAKYFFFKDSSTGIWNYGTFKSNGTTPDHVLTATPGKYRRRFLTIDTVDYVEIVNANNIGKILTDLVPITSIAKTITGTAYTDKAEFEAATNEFFISDGVRLLDASGNTITMASGEPRILSCEYTRPANTNARPANGAINETVSIIKELLSADSKQAANLNGGGGVVINGSIVSNNTSDVGRQFGIIFLREDISPIIADNAVQTILYANQGKRIMVVYATMEAQSAGSDMVIGRFNLPFEYQCKADSKALKALIFDVTGGTTASGSKYMVNINVQVQK